MKVDEWALENAAQLVAHVERHAIGLTWAHDRTTLANAPWATYRYPMACPTCGDALITVPNDDPAYGPSTLYFCETAGAAHIPFGWEPEEAS